MSFQSSMFQLWSPNLSSSQQSLFAKTLEQRSGQSWKVINIFDYRKELHSKNIFETKYPS